MIINKIIDQNFIWEEIMVFKYLRFFTEVFQFVLTFIWRN